MTVTIESKGKNYTYPEFCTALHAHKIDWDIIVVKIETLIVFSVQEFERLINLENLQQNKKGYNAIDPKIEEFIEEVRKEEERGDFALMTNGL